jgi:two-component system chemotaxis response regulator CheB
VPHGALKLVSDDTPSSQPVSILIIDDSLVARAAIARMIDASDRFMVVGAVGGAREALAFLASNRVEIILLDLEMPGVNGMSALPDLIAAGAGARVLIVSSTAGIGAAATLQALARGAADTLEKPSIGTMGARFQDMLIGRLLRLADGVIRPPPAMASVPPPASLPSVPDFDVVAIGASTGGIHALSELLRAIPPGIDVPILITQHLPASFMPYFAAQLALLTGRPCDVAHDLMRMRPGRIVVAPGDAHLRCGRLSEGWVIRLSTAPAVSGCMPSVDPMFASVAETFGARALCVVLSGMGRDGAIGARAVMDAGGAVIVQDRASSVVWGMPGAVANGGGATAVLAPAQIGAVIARRRPSAS